MSNNYIITFESIIKFSFSSTNPTKKLIPTSIRNKLSIT